jgi:hypothetical protein
MNKDNLNFNLSDHSLEIKEVNWMFLLYNVDFNLFSVTIQPTSRHWIGHWVGWISLFIDISFSRLFIKTYKNILWHVYDMFSAYFYKFSKIVYKKANSLYKKKLTLKISL